MSAAYIKVSAGVRYWEDATINGVADENGILTPCRNGDYWEPLIELETGRILNWTKGVTADIHFKVCDDGEYWLLDDAKQRVGKWGGYYVPNNFLCHGDHGYGDYIIMKINADGFVQKWLPPVIEWACDCPEDDDLKSQRRWKKLDAKGGAA